MATTDAFSGYSGDIYANKYVPCVRLSISVSAR